MSRQRANLMVWVGMIGICLSITVAGSAEPEESSKYRFPFKPLIEKMLDGSDEEYFRTTIKRLKKRGYFLNQRSETGYTLIDFAAIYNRADVVFLLLYEFLSDSRVKAHFYQAGSVSPAFWAAWHGHEDLFKRLLKYGMKLVDQHPTSGMPLLCHALERVASSILHDEYTKIIWFLLKNRPHQIALLDMGDNNCLYYCVGEYANYHFAQQILEMSKLVVVRPGDLILHQNAAGQSPYSIAQEAGQKELIALMNSYLPSAISSAASAAVDLLGSRLRRLWF